MNRFIQTSARLLRALVIGSVIQGATNPAAATPPVTSEPLSPEGALQWVEIGSNDRPVLSPDGRFLAYSTIARPPSRSVTSLYGGEIPILPNGMLSSMVGARLYVTDMKTEETTEIHAGKWSNWNAAFSPDASQIAFLSDSDGKPQVWVADIRTGKARRGSDAQVFVKRWNDLDRPAWSKSGTALYVLTVMEPNPAPLSEASSGTTNRVTVTVKVSGAETKAVATEVPRIGREFSGVRATRTAIERIEIVAGSHRALFSVPGEAQPYAYEMAPSEKWIAYLTAKSGEDSKYELFVAPSGGGEARSFGIVDQIIYTAPAQSQEYSAIFHWTPESDRLVFVQNGELWLADLSKGEMVRPLRLAPEMGKVSAPSNSAYPEQFDQIGFTADGSTVIARLAADDALAFAVVPLNGASPHRIVVKQKLHYRGMIFRDRDNLWQPQPDAFVLQGSEFVNGKQMVLRIQLSTGDATPLTEEFSDFTFVGSASPDSIVLKYTNAATPPDLYQFDSSLRQLRRLTRINPALDGLSAGSNVTFTTEVPSYDGSMRMLKTGILLPSGYRHGQHLPAIVKIYPGYEMSKSVNKFGGDRLAGSELAQFWLSRGYAIVLPDLLPLTPIARGDGNLIRELRDYLLPQINHAIDLGYIDANRLVLEGHSQGGYATASILTETNLFRAGVAYSPAPLDLFSTSWTGWPAWAMRLQSDANPWTAFKQYLTNSPYHQADKIRTPILLIHGTLDSVPSASSEEMFRGLEQLGKTAQLALYKDEPHSVAGWSLPNAIDAQRRVLEFVTRYAPVTQTGQIGAMR